MPAPSPLLWRTYNGKLAGMWSIQSENMRSGNEITFVVNEQGGTDDASPFGPVTLLSPCHGTGYLLA